MTRNKTRRRKDKIRRQSSAIRSWYSDLSLVKKLFAGLLAVAAAFVTLAGTVEAAGKLTAWWEGRIQETPWLGGVEIWQKGTQRYMTIEGDDVYSRKVRVHLSPEPFELRLPELAREVPIDICAWTDDSIFNLESVARRSIDKPSTEAVSCLDGRGMVPGRRDDPVTLILSQKRPNRYITEGGKRTQTSGWDKIFVSSVAPEPTETPPNWEKDFTSVRELRQELFLVIYANLNRSWDGKIDRDEYQYLILDFDLGLPILGGRSSSQDEDVDPNPRECELEEKTIKEVKGNDQEANVINTC